jgi:TolA-binding protein
MRFSFQFERRRLRFVTVYFYDPVFGGRTQESKLQWTDFNVFKFKVIEHVNVRGEEDQRKRSETQAWMRQQLCERHLKKMKILHFLILLIVLAGVSAQGDTPAVDAVAVPALDSATEAHSDECSLPPDASHENQPHSQIVDMWNTDDAEVSNDKITRLEEELAASKEELANAIAELNQSFQIVKSLEDKIERMEVEHIKELNETFNELESISKEFDKYKRQLDQNEEKCKVTRMQLSERDQELRDMHHHAMNQYVNFTLIGNDILELVQDMLSATSRRINDRLGRHSHRVNPKIHRAKRETKSKYGNAKKYLQLKVASTQRSLNRHWSKSTHVRPLVEETWGKVARYTFEIYHPYEPIVNDFKESMYLSSLSAIQITSNGVLNYLDNHVERKAEIEKHRREQDKERAKRRGKHRHHPPPRKIPSDIKISASGEITVEPPYLHKKIRPVFEFARDNAKGLVAQGSRLLPLFLTLYFGNSLGIGIFLYFFAGLPNELMWAFAFSRLVLRMQLGATTNKSH